MAMLIPRPSYPPYSASGGDEGREEVDRLLTRTEKKVHAVYLQAAREMRQKADAYLAEFLDMDKKQAERVARGEISAKEYQQWRISHILTGRRWYEMAEVLAADMTASNEIAATIINGLLPDVFAVGFNYSLYQGELTGGFQTSFTLYDRDTVMRLIAEDPDLLPVQAKINVSDDMRWNKRQINSAVTQGIVQGETINEIATRMASQVAGMNENTAIRNARTACTSAENGGRYHGYRRLRDAGVHQVIEWCATLDSRTRHEHRLLDGQRREVDEPFEVSGQKILYAGDPNAPQGLIWNCRCTMLAWVKGFEENREIKAQAFPTSEYASYTEWKFAKQNEQRAKKPRVNPDNPSYGYAEDFKRGDLTKAGKIAIIEPEAIIEGPKITDFCLKRGGKHSIDFFNIGYTEQDAELLTSEIMYAFKHGERFDYSTSVHGERFCISVILGKTKRKPFVTVWQIDNGTTTPRLITIYREDVDK